MVKQISDNGIYLLIIYIKTVLRRVAKRLSYIEDARCLKVNVCSFYNLLMCLEISLALAHFPVDARVRHDDNSTGQYKPQDK